METIRLEFQPRIKAKILELLSSFSSEELKIVQEKTTFEEEKRMIQSRIDKIDNGTIEYSTFEELDVLLEETISKYEVKTVQEDADFIKNRWEVQKAYVKMKSGTEKFYTIEEVDAFLDETFSEYDS